jgi:hypothetical protein
MSGGLTSCQGRRCRPWLFGSDDQPRPTLFLHTDMFIVSTNNDVDLDKPVIYVITIQDEKPMLYVGKAKQGHRRLRQYERLMRVYLEGGPWRPSKPDGWRRVHHALGQAIREGRRIEWCYHANAQEGEHILTAEQRHIDMLQTRGPWAWQLNR